MTLRIEKTAAGEAGESMVAAGKANAQGWSPSTALVSKINPENLLDLPPGARAGVGRGSLLPPTATRRVPRDRSHPEQLTPGNASISFFHGINELIGWFSEFLFFQSFFFHLLNKMPCNYRAVLSGITELSLSYTSRSTNAENILILNQHSATPLQF